jgi:hypothetical protein
MNWTQGLNINLVKKQEIKNFGNSSAEDHIGLMIRIFKDNVMETIVRMEKGIEFYQIIDNYLIDGLTLEDNIRRKYKLNKDIGEAKENIGLCGKIYLKLLNVRNQLALERNMLKLVKVNNFEGMKKGFFTCHNKKTIDIIFDEEESTQRQDLAKFLNLKT